MRHTEKLVDNHRLLDELTELAAELEAGAAASLFRFGASRAYNEIVQMRLSTIGERKVEDLPTWSSFLTRRMQPAMRTCATTEERQATLSEKLARAANLLRTKVDVELERQNRDLLKSMNERTRLQLRLQTTVEGLSVGAVSYYVVGLFGYLMKGLHDEGVPVDVTLATALFVPVAVLASGGWCGASGAGISPGTVSPSLRNPRGDFVSIMYHDGNRQLQDRFDSRRISDRLEEKLTRTAFTEDDKTFIEGAAYFFIATADAEGRPDCSFKGGLPGFVRVTGPSELAFPDYDGNGMFKSLGNVLVNPNVGLLFIAMHDKPKRLRVNGSAQVSDADPLLNETVGAQLIVRVDGTRDFPELPALYPGRCR